MKRLASASEVSKARASGEDVIAGGSDENRVIRGGDGSLRRRGAVHRDGRRRPPSRASASLGLVSPAGRAVVIRLQHALALIGLYVFLDERARVLAVFFQEC